MDLDIILRTSAVLIVAALIAMSLRRAAPSTRHLVWQLAIIAVLLAPVLAPLAKVAVPRVPGVPEVPRVWFSEGATPSSPRSTAGPATLVTKQNQTLGSVGTFISIGTAGVLGWFLLCWFLSGVSVWRGSTAAPEAWVNDAKMLAARIGLKRPIAVRRLRRDASPHVAGFFSSVVMMPPSATTWTTEARHAALVHELTHIKRRDRTTQALAHVACALYWFNPLVWHAAAGLARERQRACDDAVLKFGAKPSDYATLLLDLARSAQSWTPVTALSMARPSAIEGRLLSILAAAVRTPRLYKASSLALPRRTRSRCPTGRIQILTRNTVSTRERSTDCAHCLASRRSAARHSSHSRALARQRHSGVPTSHSPAPTTGPLSMHDR